MGTEAWDRERTEAMRLIDVLVLKFNQSHDAQGRFASSTGAAAPEGPPEGYKGWKRRGGLKAATKARRQSRGVRLIFGTDQLLRAEPLGAKPKRILNWQPGEAPAGQRTSDYANRIHNAREKNLRNAMTEWRHTW